MSTANFAGRGGVMTRIAPHATGHEWARDGTCCALTASAASAGSPRTMTRVCVSFTRLGVQMRTYTT
jgi:hypothetical protein